MRSLGHQPIISMVSHDFKVSWFSVIKKYNLRTSRNNKLQINIFKWFSSIYGRINMCNSDII